MILTHIHISVTCVLTYCLEFVTRTVLLPIGLHHVVDFLKLDVPAWFGVFVPFGSNDGHYLRGLPYGGME